MPAPTPSRLDKLWQLEALRGAAAVYVMAGHLCRPQLESISPLLGLTLGFGQEAVIAFFLLSGFVIHWSCSLKPDLTLGAYLRARAVRLYPLFLLTLLIAGLAAAPQEPNTSARTLLGNVLMLQDWSLVKPGVWVDVYANTLVLWTLSYEWWFYLLYFPLNRYFSPGSSAWAATLLSVSQGLFYLWHPNQASRFLMYFVIWWTGVELARSYQANRLAKPGALVTPLAGMVVICVFLAIGIGLSHASGQTLHFGRYPVLELRHFLAALALVAAAFVWRRAGWRGYRLLLGAFIPIAPFGYALYLLHEPLAIHLAPFAFLHNPWIIMGLNLGFVGVAAWLGEKYFQAWCRRLFLP